MSRCYLLLAAGLLLVLGRGSAGDPPVPPANKPWTGPLPGLAAGRWRVTFANGVVESCAIRADGTAAVAEPSRSSEGRVSQQGGALVIACADDRTERWTPVGPRMVVEHWCPASQLPAITPVLGIAERTP